MTNDFEQRASQSELVRHLFKSDGGPPWVSAVDESHARRLLKAEGYDQPRILQQIPDDEAFTMLFEDAPEGLEPDNVCECEAKDIEQFGCECEASDNGVTMPASFWANSHHANSVFGEYDG